jgi:hypothetical protein
MISPSNTSTAFYSAGGVIDGTVNIRNNNFSHQNSGYAIYIGAPDVINTIDYNNLYTAGNFISYWGGRRVINLRELQQSSGKNSNSLSVYPHYDAFDDLHTSAPWLDGRGTALPRLTTDFDGDLRDALAPDIGADEFTPDQATTTPLSGTYTIGSGGDYPDFAAAIDDARLKGVSGPLIFDILSGTYNERIDMHSFPGTSTQNTVTFQSQSGDTNDVEFSLTTSGMDDNYIVRLYGADFITFQNLTFRAQGAQYARIFDILWGADSIQIRNNIISGASASGAQSERTLIYSGDSFYRSRLIEGNTFYRGSYSIYMRRGSSTYPYPQGLHIHNNQFKDNGYSAMYLQFYDAPTVSGNTIDARSYGIQALTCENDLKIMKNKINTDSQYGIYVGSCPASLSDPGLIANNFVHVGGTGSGYGLYLNNSNFHNIYHNSIHITATSTTLGRALNIYNSDDINVINNVFANSGGGYAYYKDNISTVASSDNNDLYAIGTTLAYWNSGHTDLATLQAESGMDINSFSTDPSFTSDTDLHASANLLDLAGTPLAEVTDDIDDESRDPVAPDIGADEFGQSSGGGDTEFISLDTDLPGLTAAKASWGDYDSDGDLDLLLIGSNDIGSVTAQIYNNENGNFYDIAADLTGVGFGSADWGDYDRDGDLDILISGATGRFPAYNSVTKIYRNEGNDNFNEITAIELPGYDHSAVAWGDYDNDGDQDFIVAGSYQSKIYRNFGSDVFIEQNIILTGVTAGDVAWGDYDCDGDLDLALAGRAGSSNLITVIYRNDDATFNAIDAGLPGISDGSLDWGDYDGYLDLVICGGGSGQLIGAVYKNNLNDNFTLIDSGLQGIMFGNADWGDYDNDGDLDLVLTGSAMTTVYINESMVGNAPPSPPTNLHVSAIHNSATLYWDAGSDDHTPQAGLTYNLRIGTAAGISNILHPMALSDGLRTLPDFGNMQQIDYWNIDELLPGITYYWSVQAIDNGYAGSEFAAEGSFTTPFPIYFNEIATSLPGLYDGSVEWGDYDNDGDLDIVLSGKSEDEDNLRYFAIYRNDGSGSFSDIQADIPGLYYCDVAWADFDNDGDLDVLHAGEKYINNYGTPSTVTYTKIYRNEGNDTFSEAYSTDTGLGNASVDWGDFDNDGDIDILVMGTKYRYEDDGWSREEIETHYTYIFDNEGNMQFSGHRKPGQPAGYVSAGDFDNDGDLDILQSGYYLKIIEHGWGIPPTIIKEYKTSIYRNDNGSFGSIPVVLPGVSGASSWADFDNDGDLDILLTGNTNYGINDGDIFTISKIFRNDGNGQLSELVIDLEEVKNSAVAWGNYNSDNALDLVIIGLDTTDTPVIKLYRSLENRANLRPFAPTNLESSTEGTSVILSWDETLDDKTPSAALSYNLRVGTTPGAADVMSPLTLENGLRNVYHQGNTSQNTSWVLHDLEPDATYYWSVQAIDQSFIGGVPAYENSFTADPPLFSSLDIEFENLTGGDAAWGDYDNDRDLDLLLTGFIPGYNSSTPYTILYRNDGDDQFTVVDVELTEYNAKTVSWGDYNNDGDLDILLCENDDGDYRISVFRNDGDDSFTRLPTEAIDGRLYDLNWADLDSDGDLDIATVFVQSVDGENVFNCRIFRNNDEDEFVYANQFIIQMYVSKLLIADYDNDGLKDIFLTGTQGNSGKTKIFKNLGNTVFINTEFDLTGGDNGDMAIGDYDNDGDLDLVVAGDKGGSYGDRRYPFCTLYRNENGENFTEIEVDLPQLYNSNLVFADFDNDGLLDLFTSGYNKDYQIEAKLFKNLGDETFIELAGLFEPVGGGCASAADYNNDGKIDILITGREGSSSGSVSTILYRNNCVTANDAPNAPSGLSAKVTGTNVNLSWNPASDTETATSSLAYNLRIGTGSEGLETMSPGSHNDGLRQIVDLGNTFQSRSYELKDLLPDMTYFWSVQAIDQAYTGSAFATEGSFTTGTFRPQLLSVQDVPFETGPFETGGQVTLTWSKSILDTNTHLVPNYSIWRAVPVDVEALPKQINSREKMYKNDLQPLRLFKNNGLDYVWEWMADQPARKFDYYSFTAPTLFDSSANSPEEHFYLVSVHTANPKIFYDSAIGSGRSVDNLGQLMLKQMPKISAGNGNIHFTQQQSEHGPEIISATDVPHDQGGRITLSFRCSDLDSAQHLITTYSIWRALPRDGGYAWEKIAEQPAHHFTYYSMTIPTLYDSLSLTNGLHHYLICAQTSDANVFYESGISSGYSMDNLSPISPKNLSGALENEYVTLHWNPNTESDLKSYLIYRSDSPEIDPLVNSPYATAVDTVFTDMDPITNGTSFYIIRAQDIHENISPASNEIEIIVDGLIKSGSEIPKSYALYQNYPNPFNPYTTIEFDLPRDTKVNLTIYNIRGQKVATLVDQTLSAGKYRYPWRPEGLASGLYMYSIRSDNYRKVKKMVLVK